MSAPLWKTRLDRHAEKNPELSSRYQKDGGFDYQSYAEAIRRKHKLSEDEFYAELMLPEPETTGLQDAARAVVGAAGSAILGTPPEIDRATYEAGQANEAKLAPLGEDVRARYENMKQQDPQAAQRFLDSMSAQAANAVPSDSNIMDTFGTMSDETQSAWYAGDAQDAADKLEELDTVERQGGLRGAMRKEPGPWLSPQQIQGERQQAAKDLLYAQQMAKIYAQEASSAAKPEGLWGLAQEIGGRLSVPLATAFAGGSVGQVAGLGRKGVAALAGGSASVSQYPQDVVRNIAAGMTPEQAAAKAQQQAAVRAPIDAALGVLGGSRIVQAGTQAAGNVLSGKASEAVAGRATTNEDDLLGALFGTTFGAALPNVTGPVAAKPPISADPVVDAGAAAMDEAISQFKIKRLSEVENLKPAPETKVEKPATAVEGKRKKRVVPNVPDNTGEVAAPVDALTNLTQVENIPDAVTNTPEFKRPARSRNERAARLAPLYDNGAEAQTINAPSAPVNPANQVRFTGIDTATPTQNRFENSRRLTARTEEPAPVVADVQNERAVRFAPRNTDVMETAPTAVSQEPAALDVSEQVAASSVRPIRSMLPEGATSSSRSSGAQGEEEDGNALLFRDVESDASFDTQGANTSRYQSADEFEADVSSGLFNKEARNFRKLKEQGKVTVFHGMEDLRTRNPGVHKITMDRLLQQTGRTNVEPAAWVDSAGNLFINSANINRGEAKAKIVHEVSSHMGVDTSGLLDTFFDRVKELSVRGVDLAKRAIGPGERIEDALRRVGGISDAERNAAQGVARAVEGYRNASPQVKRQEAVAKFLELSYQRLRQNAPLGRAGALFREITGRMRLAYDKVNKFFGGKGITLSDNDLVTLARMQVVRPKGAVASKATAEAGASFSIDNSPTPATKKKGALKAAFSPEGRADRDLFDILLAGRNAESAARVVNRANLNKIKAVAKDESEWQAALNYMGGLSGGEDLSKEARAAIDPFRAQRASNSDVLAAMTQYGLERGWLSPSSPDVQKMGAIIAARDSYTRRSYQAQDDERWLNKLREEEAKSPTGRSRYTVALDNVRNIWTIKKPVEELDAKEVDAYADLWGVRSDLPEDAKRAELAQIQVKPRADLEETFKQIRDNMVLAVNKQLKATTSIANALARNMSALQTRKNVPKWMRDLLGEYKDPVVVAAKTLNEQAKLIVHTKTLMQLAGSPMVRFNMGDAGFSKKLEGAKYGPLNGAYMSDVNAKLVEDFVNGDMFNTELSGVLGNIFGKSWRSLAGFIKSNQVGLSLSSAVNQGIGNMLSTVSTGQAFNWRAYKGSAKATGAGIASGFEIDSPKFLDLIVEATKYGVAQDSTLGTELRRAITSAENRQAVKNHPARRILAVYDAFRDKAAGAFASTDEVPKIWLWLAEMEDLKKAFPNMPESELKAQAAKRVQKSFFTFTEAPMWVKKISANSVVAPFTTFLYESVRVPLTNIAIGYDDLKRGIATGNAHLASMGFRRLAGSALVLAAPAMLVANDGEEETALRDAVPRYYEDAPLQYVGTEGEVTKYKQFGKYQPFPIVQGILSGAINGDADAALRAAYEPFISRGIGVDEMIAISANLTKPSRNAKDQEALEREFWSLASIISPLGKTGTELVREGLSTVDPAFVSDRQKRGLDVRPEMSTDYFADFIGRLTGLGPDKLVLAKGTRSALSSAVLEYNNTHSINRAALIDGIVNSSVLTQQDIDDAVQNYVTAEVDAANEVEETLRAIEKLRGIKRHEIVARAREAGLQVGILDGKPSFDRIRATLFEAASKKELGNKVNEAEVKSLQQGKYNRDLNRMIHEAFRKAKTKQEE